MKRFNLSTSHPLIASVVLEEDDEGQWVRFDDVVCPHQAVSRLKELREELGNTDEVDDYEDEEQIDAIDRMLNRTYDVLGEIIREMLTYESS